jgi:hypothetical protein
VLNIPIYQGQLTLTTTGTSGAATLTGDILNIPQYSGGGGGAPAGGAGQVQFNSTPAGSFAASANLAWDDSNVRLNIGAPLAPTGRLNVKSAGTTSSTVNLRLTDSGNTELFRVNDDGSANLTGNLSLGNSSSINVGVSGTNRRSSIFPTAFGDNLPILAFYPATGTNVTQSVQVIPRGSGAGSLKSQISVYNTDLVADLVNYEFISLRALGTSFAISSGQAGTGTTRPLLLSAGSVSAVGTNLNQLWLNTNGTVSLNKTSTNYQLDVTAASTFDGLRVVGSSNSSGRVAFQVQSSTATLYNIDNNGKISYLANAISGTTGNQTIDTPSGNVNFAAGATALTVTNSLCTTSSLVFATIRTNDATATIKNVVPAAGSFTINLGAAATAVTSVGFFIIN